MDYTNLQEVLLWLTGMGAPAVVMYVLSWVVENWKGWSTLPHDVKFLLPMIMSILLTMAASMLLKYPDVIATIQPWFQMIVSAVIAYLSSQKAYMTAMKAGYGRRFASRSSVRPEMK